MEIERIFGELEDGEILVMKEIILDKLEVNGE